MAHLLMLMAKCLGKLLKVRTKNFITNDVNNIHSIGGFYNEKYYF